MANELKISKCLPLLVREQLVAAAKAAAQVRINAGHNGDLSKEYLARIHDIDRIRTFAALMYPRMFH